MSENLIAPDIDLPIYKLHRSGTYKVAGFFGGFIAIGILSFRNYQNLNDMKRAKLSLVYAFIPTFLMLSFFFFQPEVADKIPNFLLSLFQMWVGSKVAESYFDDIYKNHRANKGEYYNGWYTFAIIILSVFINVIIIFIVLVMSDPEIGFSDLLDFFI